MKRFSLKISLIGLAALLSGLLASCNGPKQELPTEFKAELKEVYANYVEVSISSPAEVEMAYLLETQPIETLFPAVIFSAGKTLKVNNGDVITIKDQMLPETDYYLYIVARVDGYSDIFTLNFKTPAFAFDKVLTLLDVGYRGYEVRVTVPQEVRQRGTAEHPNVLRYAYANKAMINYSRMRGQIEVDNLIANGDIYNHYIAKDTTFFVNQDNEYETDENGNIIFDEWGDPIPIHDPVVPGEPCVFFVGEFEWFEGNTNEGGYSSSYITPLWDKATDTWTGVYDKIEFKVKDPEPLETNISIEVYDETCIDAIVRITPDDKVYQYLYTIVDKGTYEMLIDVYLDGDENLVQWFMTSYLGYLELYPNLSDDPFSTEPIEINTFSYAQAPLNHNTTYYVLLVAMGDEQGISQKFVMKEFKTTDKTMAKPIIQVTPLPQDPDEPYLAGFNVKHTNKDQSGELLGCYYGCNYKREWQLQENAGNSYESILSSNYQFDSDALAAMETEAGYNVWFSSLDGEVSRMVVYGCNTEYTYNDIDTKNPDGCPAIADYTTPYAPAVPEVKSDLYELLEGEWIATATLSASQVDDDGNVLKYNKEHSSVVTITNGMPEHPETLSEEVYAIYAKNDYTREETDAMWEEFLTVNSDFETNRLSNKNRLLCSGFLDFDYYEDISRLETRTPYDLFINDKDYVSVDVPQLFYDFGPKWYIEVQPDGTAIVPFHSAVNPPMSNWAASPFYVGGYSPKGGAFIDSNSAYPGFPVEVSEDGNTVTIKAMPVDYGEGVGVIDFYMNACIFDGSVDENYNPVLEIVAPVISEIVMTRKTATKAADRLPEFNAVPEIARVAARNIDGSDMKAPVVKTIKSMTKFAEPVEYKQIDNYQILDAEAIDFMLRTGAEKKYGIKFND